MEHISPQVAQDLVNKGFVTSVCIEETLLGDFFCKFCVYTKATRKPVSKMHAGEKDEAFGDKIHSDIWRPAPVQMKRNKHYYITFIDNCTRFTYLYFLVQKSEAFTTYKILKVWCLTQLGSCIKVLYSDCRGEYLDKEFVLYLQKQGTEQKLTVHNISSQNGVAE